MGGEAGTGVIALHKVLGELGSFGLEKRQLQEDATASCPCLQGGHQEDEARFLKVEPGGRTGDHGCKTKRGSEQIYKIKRTVRHWNGLSLELFKTWLAKS